MQPFARFKSLGPLVLIPVIVVLLVLEHNAALSPQGHAVLLLIIVVGVGVLARDWMIHNP